MFSGELVKLGRIYCIFGKSYFIIKLCNAVLVLGDILFTCGKSGAKLLKLLFSFLLLLITELDLRIGSALILRA